LTNLQSSSHKYDYYSATENNLKSATTISVMTYLKSEIKDFT